MVRSEPCTAAQAFFTDHHDFYFEDPTLREGLLTPRFFRALKRHYDTVAVTGQIGALDCDPWTNAQDGDISEPYSFNAIKGHDSESTVRFDYTFTLGANRSVPQSVLMKFQRVSSTGNWKLADFVMPNHESLVGLLEKIR